MFGYIIPDQQTMTPEARWRYRTAYCGLRPRAPARSLLPASTLRANPAAFALPEAFRGCQPLLATQGTPDSGVLRPWEALLYLRDAI